ncbi:hypothetical protein ACSS6W_004427 [Trichoderma asperelloides]
MSTFVLLPEAGWLASIADRPQPMGWSDRCGEPASVCENRGSNWYGSPVLFACSGCGGAFEDRRCKVPRLRSIQNEEITQSQSSWIPDE